MSDEFADTYGLTWEDIEDEVKIQAATQYVKDRGWHLTPERRAERLRRIFAQDDEST